MSRAVVVISDSLVRALCELMVYAKANQLTSFDRLEGRPENGRYRLTMWLVP